jgi:hypothetical protein
LNTGKTQAKEQEVPHKDLFIRQDKEPWNPADEFIPPGSRLYRILRFWRYFWPLMKIFDCIKKKIAFFTSQIGKTKNPSKLK